jgi:predicted PurR-regulated permease PerM
MRTALPISSARPIRDRSAACICAVLTLALLVPGSAGAAPSLFGGTTTVTGAAKPAKGVKVAPTTAKVKTAPAVKVKTTAAPAAATPTTTATTATTATTETSSKTSTPMIMAVVALFVVLGGIAFYILRDARSVAPVVEGAATGGTRNPEGRLRRRRAQAKAAKQQRKRHHKR